MGTVMRITVWAQRDATEEVLGARRVYESLDARLSHYKADSEINRLEAGRETRVSRELFTVLEFARRLWLRSGGVFDVTVRGRTVGFQHVLLGRGTVTLAAEGVQLDLGGIAKGFANDCASNYLRRRGLERHLLAASGDVLVWEAPPGAAGWTVGFQDTERVLRQRAVSTSGNTYQPGHIVDARNGEKVMRRETVTVIAPESMTADALATACLILNPEERGPLLRQYQGVELISA
jgi:thiamine biosynthesis lipoprotein